MQAPVLRNDDTLCLYMPQTTNSFENFLARLYDNIFYHFDPQQISSPSSILPQVIISDLSEFARLISELSDPHDNETSIFEENIKRLEIDGLSSLLGSEEPWDLEFDTPASLPGLLQSDQAIFIPPNNMQEPSETPMVFDDLYPHNLVNRHALDMFHGVRTANISCTPPHDMYLQNNFEVSYLYEKEAKRFKRKQSNRESARRSRLRKQAEVEELHRRNIELTHENHSMRQQMDMLWQSYFHAVGQLAKYAEHISRVIGRPHNTLAELLGVDTSLPHLTISSAMTFDVDNTSSSVDLSLISLHSELEPAEKPAWFEATDVKQLDASLSWPTLEETTDISYWPVWLPSRLGTFLPLETPADSTSAMLDFFDH